jgi:hypothetical protein
MVIPPLFDETRPIVTWVVLYFGPDGFLPVTSAMGALVGLMLMFWTRLTNAAKRLWLLISDRFTKQPT